MRTIGMVVYGEVAHDARVRRAASALVAAGYRVVIGCLAPTHGDQPESLEGAEVVAVPLAAGFVRPGDLAVRRARRTGRVAAIAARAAWLAGYARGIRAWRAASRARLPRANLWIGHDLLGVWVAAGLAARDRARYVYDSHELWLEAGSAATLPSPIRAALATWERRLAQRAAGVITVNPSIAAELGRRYAIRPTIVMNVPRSSREPRDNPFSSEMGLGARNVILYHGALSPQRGIEQLVQVARTTPPERAVVLLGDGPMRDDLRRLSNGSDLDGRLFVHDAVDIEDLPDWVGSAAVGVIAFQATTLNNVLATPNKLFDFLVAGVPVVVSDFPEMRRITAEVDGGLTCRPDDPASIAQAVDELLSDGPQVREMKRAQLRRVAGEHFGWATQAERLVRVVRTALGEP